MTDAIMQVVNCANVQLRSLRLTEYLEYAGNYRHLGTSAALPSSLESLGFSTAGRNQARCPSSAHSCMDMRARSCKKKHNVLGDMVGRSPQK